MSELAKRNPNQFESSIERKNKRMTIQLGQKAILFDYTNTQLFEHSEAYAQFDHVFRVNDDRAQGVYYLRDDFPELWDILAGESYPRHVQEYPTETDEQRIMEFIDQRLSGALEQMLTEDDDE